jgi:hypothetical protein
VCTGPTLSQVLKDSQGGRAQSVHMRIFHIQALSFSWREAQGMHKRFKSLRVIKLKINSGKNSLEEGLNLLGG